MKSNRLLCFVLAAVLACSGLSPMTVPAAEMEDADAQKTEGLTEDWNIKEPEIEEFQEKMTSGLLVETKDIKGVSTANGWSYTELEDGSLKISGYTGTDKGVTIPAELDGKKVTMIGERAFQGNTSLTDVVIPEGVTRISSYAFYGCSSLTHVELPKTLTRIDEYGFYGCSSLGSIELPEGLRLIGNYIFQNCSNLTAIKLPENVTTIADGAFWGCSSLEDIEMLGKVKYVGSMAFSNCSSLKEIVLPESTVFIKYYAFSNCSSLTSVEMPNVESIKDYAFYGCSSLTDIEIPESVTSIGEEVFAGCGSDLVLIVTAGSYGEAYAKENAIAYRYKECTHNYKTTITKATTKKNGSIVKRCTICGKEIKTTIYAAKTVKLSKTSFTYNGKVRKPSVAVKNSQGKKLKKGTDYTVKYPKGRKQVGRYTVTIKFKGKYSGTVKRTFTIVPKGTSITKVSAKSKGFTVKWKKQKKQITGYKISYSTNRKFTKKTTKTVTAAKKKLTSKSVFKLKAKKKYYIRIRTYKTVKVNGKSAKIYSAWSKTKTVTTKK